MKKKASSASRGLSLIAIAGVCILILVGMVALNDASQRHEKKKFFMTAADEIKLPDNFELVNEVFTDDRCLDTCANLTLYYRSKDGKSLDRNIVEAELARNGYKHEVLHTETKDYVDPIASKLFMNGEGKNIPKAIKIEQLNAPPTELVLNLR